MLINRWMAAGFSIAAGLIVAVIVFATVGDSAPPRLPPNADASTIGVDQQRSDPSDVVFDQSTVRTYSIQISDEEFDKLRSAPTAEVYVQAAVEIHGQRYEPVGIRYKGFFGMLRFCFDGGKQTCAKLSWKLKFNHFEPSLRFHGLKRLNFHSMNSDETQMREVLSYQVFRDAGVAAPRAVHASLQLNGEPLGLFALVEDIDDRFIADRFRDGGRGVLYKEIWPGNIESLWVFQNSLEDAIARGPLDASGMTAFSEDFVAAETNEQRYEALIGNLQDSDDLFNYLAADRLSDNWDGIVAWYCVPECGNHNYFWYQDAISGRFTLIPWDLENTWRSPSPIRTYFQMPDWDDVDRSCRERAVFLEIPALAPHCDALIHALATLGWERYIEASRHLMREAISLELMHERVNRLSELIDQHVRADTKGPGYLEWQENVGRLSDEIDERWAYIDAKIEAWDSTGKVPGDG
jgi:spore coat protein CotH